MEKKIAYRAGSYIYIEGDETVNSVFIVEKGRIKFQTENEFISRNKTSAGPGEIFGFISSLCGKPRMESAIAASDSVVVELSRERFLTLAHKNPAIAFKIINSIADELRSYDAMMFSLNNTVSTLTPEQGLYTLALYYFKTGENNSAFYILNRYLKIYSSGSMILRVKEMLRKLEEQGIRTIAEPVRNGIYSHYHDRQIIFSEFEEGNDLYIIKEGRVKISKYS
jgi:CRP-like cAMP-binding protein